jgi:hypothetical protein
MRIEPVKNQFLLTRRCIIQPLDAYKRPRLIFYDSIEKVLNLYAGTVLCLDQLAAQPVVHDGRLILQGVMCGQAKARSCFS